MNTRYGRNDRIRTCDIVVPNHARYQLRYIPILFFYRLGGAYFLFFFPRKALFGRKHRPVCRCPLGRRVC